MAPPKKNLSPYYAEISLLYSTGENAQRICDTLQRKYNVNVSERTMRSTLTVLGLRRDIADNVTQALKDGVSWYFSSTELNDAQIAEELKAGGFKTSARQIKAIRLQMRLLRRSNDPDLREQDRQEAFNRVQEELHSGEISYGYRMLVTHLRAVRGFALREAWVQEAIKELDPEGVQARKPGMKAIHRRAYDVPGPDYVWSVDGYLSLRNYGIEIYAGIDAYSRSIIWWYVGVHGCTQISVASQFLRVVEAKNTFPELIRSDRGSETAMMADFQVALGRQHMMLDPARTMSLEEIQRLPVRKFHLFGTSTANVRIERWWRTLYEGAVGSWKVSSIH